MGLPEPTFEDPGIERASIGALGIPDLSDQLGGRAYRSPPGRQSTSPCSALATRARINSRSDSRFRYFAGQTLTDSPWSRTAAQALRSARRVTARAVCSSAAPGVPPGSTKLRNTGSAAL